MIIRNNKILEVVQQKADAVSQHPTVKRLKKKFPKVKASTVAIYTSVFFLIITIVFTSYQPPKKTQTVVNAVTPKTVNQTSTTSVDGVLASSIAASVAQAANLPIADEIANLAVSIKVNNDMLQQTGIFKPQVVGSAVAGRSVTSYTVQSGETVGSLADKFGLTKDTIKWANNLTYDSLYEGQTLQILPIDGVIHEVVEGETIDSIATKYSVDKDRLVLYNDLDISGLIVNTKIILPNATLPSNERPGYIAPVTRVYGYYGGDTTFIGYGGGFNSTIKGYLPHLDSLYARSNGNTMAVGNCTWWAWERRLALGRRLPSGALGNGGSWYYTLNSMGYTVDNNPEAGAVAESWGHVMVVESVNKNVDGNIESITISEMNNGGVFNISIRTIPAANIGNFWYIH